MCLTENRFSRNEMWCAVDNHQYKSHNAKKNFRF